MNDFKETFTTHDRRLCFVFYLLIFKQTFMEQIRIIRQNKLIAHFMGEVIRRDGKIALKDKEPLTNQCIVDAKYHYSWDWLMPVVEKIEAIQGMNFNIFSNEARITVRFDISFSSITETKIESVYNVVVEYIEWYNLNKA